MTTLTPFDDRDVVETTVRIVGAGDGIAHIVTADLSTTALRYISHFATCPNADRHRRRARR